MPSCSGETSRLQQHDLSPAASMVWTLSCS
jgi:hypothetical protein